MLNRRSMLKGTSALMLAALNGGITLRPARAQSQPGRVVVFVLLVGGADLRQLFAPDPNIQRDYASAYWNARAAMTRQAGDINTYTSVYNAQYTRVTIGGSSFGVHNSAGWLVQQLLSGKAAVVANVDASDDRSHTHSRDIWRAGDPSIPDYDASGDGWGGRLVYSLSDANVVTVCPTPTIFSQGPEAGNRNARALHIVEPRDFALNETNSGPANGAIGRALTAYYAAKQDDAKNMPDEWPFHRILNTENTLRTLGRSLNNRLAQVAPQRPDSLKQLYAGTADTILTDKVFGKQCAALYDCAMAADILKMRAVYMEQGSYDTHTNQPNQFTTYVTDLYGAGKGLSTITAELANKGLDDDIVFVMATEFGRQLVANSQGGTDHGSGNYVVVVGGGVRGGVFGEMFPAREIAGSPGSRPMDLSGSDILGQTSFERVLGEVCDWVNPGSGDSIFPGRSGSPLEPGVDLSQLMA